MRLVRGRSRAVPRGPRVRRRERPCASWSKKSEMRFRSVSRSISRTFLIPTATWPAIARASSTRRVASATISPSSSSSATSGTARRVPRRARVESSGPSSASGMRRARVDPAGYEHRSRRSAPAAGSIRYTWHASASSRRPCAGGDRRQQLLKRLGTRDRLGELGQLPRARGRGAASPRKGGRSRSRPRRARRRSQRSRPRRRELARRLRVRRDRRRSTSPLVPEIGTERSDWNRSSSSSGTYLTRGSSSRFSRTKAGSRCSAAHHARPSPAGSSICPTSASYGSDAARRTSCALVLDEVDEAAVHALASRQQPHNGRQHLVELERRRDRRDDLLQELLARLQGHRA